MKYSKLLGPLALSLIFAACEKRQENKSSPPPKDPTPKVEPKLEGADRGDRGTPPEEAVHDNGPQVISLTADEINKWLKDKSLTDITMDAEHLDLSFKKLTSSDIKYIKSFKKLKSIDISGNDISFFGFTEIIENSIIKNIKAECLNQLRFINNISEKASQITEISLQNNEFDLNLVSDNLPNLKILRLGKNETGKCSNYYYESYEHNLLDSFVAPNLEELYLPYMNLKDEDLVSISKQFPNLKVLDISGNSSLSDNIANTLTKFTKLKTLIFIPNSVSGSSSDAIITDKFFEVLKNLNSLESIKMHSELSNIANQHFSAEIFTYLKELPNLKELDLGYLAGWSTFSSMFQTPNTSVLLPFVNLEALTVSTTDLDSFFDADVFEKMANLKKLNIDGFSHNDDSLKSLSKLSKLESLTIGNIGNVKHYSKYLGDISSLKKLEITDHYNNIWEIGTYSLQGLANAKNLEEFSIQFTLEADDIDINGLDKIENLKVLRLKATFDDKVDFSRLTKLNKLKSLQLGYLYKGIKIDDKKLKNIAKIESLEELIIKPTQNSFFDIQLEHLAPLKNLKHLNIEDLNDTVLDSLNLPDFQNLQYLTIRYAQMEEAENQKKQLDSVSSYIKNNPNIKFVRLPYYFDLTDEFIKIFNSRHPNVYLINSMPNLY